MIVYDGFIHLRLLIKKLGFWDLWPPYTLGKNRWQNGAKSVAASDFPHPIDMWIDTKC